ncbi:TPA: EpsG family protein, partial [Enterobacter hormaechei]|nr:EpsG family protein [Enterobacter hormaechei]
IVFLFIVFTIAVFFHGLRAPKATDLEVYYENFKSLTSFAEFAWGYSFYIVYYLISFFTTDIEGFVFGSSCILLFFFLLAIFLIVNGQCKSLVFLIFILSPSFTDMAFNTLRQGMAIPFLVLSIYYLYYKKILLSLSLIIISAGFHWNAPLIYIFAVLSLFIYKKNLKYFPSLLIIMAVVSVYYNLDLARQALKLFSFSNAIGVALQAKMDAYLNAGIDGLNYYELDIPRRIFSIIELIFYIFVLRQFSMKGVKDFTHTRYNVENYMFICFLISCLYSISLISMTWYFRNFYWALGIAPFLLGVFLSKPELYLVKNKINFVLLIIIIIAISIITTWRSGVMQMSYS